MHAYALLGAERLEEYRQACQRLAEKFGDGPVVSNRNSVARLCVLTRDTPVDVDKLMQMAVRDSNGHGNDASNLTHGACLYRSGRLDDSVKQLTELTEALDRGGDFLDQHSLSCARYYLALVRHDQGHDFQAQRLLNDANELADGLTDRLTWRLKIELDVLRREAEARIAPN